MCLSMFWHFLDVVWIGVFTFVYLMGVAAMSAHTTTATAPRPRRPRRHDVGYHSTFKGYMIGFVLSVILTAIPFWLVMAKVFDKPNTTALVILAFAGCRSWCT
jgi:heme/copper-type cytochrome/quinol oxidase subunit 4